MNRTALRRIFQLQPGSHVVYAYLRARNSPRGKRRSPYYVGVAAHWNRPFCSKHNVPVPEGKDRIVVLRVVSTAAQARDWERFYISLYGRYDVGSGRGMLHNRTDGGEGAVGLAMSEATKQKLSQINLVRTPAQQESTKKTIESNRGRKHTDEAITAAREGKFRATAAKYGIPANVYVELSDAKRRQLKVRFNRGKRGAQLTEGITIKPISPPTWEKYEIAKEVWIKQTEKVRMHVSARYRRGLEYMDLLAT